MTLAYRFYRTFGKKGFMVELDPAEAIRYAVEKLPAAVLSATSLEIDDNRATTRSRSAPFTRA